MSLQSRLRELAVAGCTFVAALSIGFVMQNGDALAARFTELPAEAPATPAVLSRIAPDSRVAPIAAQAIPAIPSLPADPQVPAPMQVSLQLVPAFALPSPQMASPPGCSVTLTAVPLPAAMVSLSLAAPCAPDRPATIHHQGLMFSALTDRDGALRLVVPALVPEAVFIADLGHDSGAVAVAQVPDVALFDRAVLQWRGIDGLGIHARAFGADYGTAGHVWSGHLGDAASDSGFLVRLGDASLPDALLAEVYSFPSGSPGRNGRITLTVEAEVTAANCGREVAAQSIRVSPGGPPFSADLTMTLPSCDAVGEFLVLSNMLMDLTLAAR